MDLSPFTLSSNVQSDLVVCNNGSKRDERRWTVHYDDVDLQHVRTGFNISSIISSYYLSSNVHVTIVFLAAVAPYISNHFRLKRNIMPPIVNSSPTDSGVNPFEDGELTERNLPSRFISRTPSPTPSENDALQRRGLISLRGSWKSCSKAKLFIFGIAGVFIILNILLVVFRIPVVSFLLPAAIKIKNIPLGWLIYIALLFVLSIPPLFGLEIMIVICGFVFGVWIGFGIVVAATVFGELANCIVYKNLCSARNKRWEKTHVDYASLSRVFKEGGIIVAIVARHSIFPSNYATAIFATCGMRSWVIAVAVFASLCFQFVMVYLGALAGGEQIYQNDAANQAAEIGTYVALAVRLVVAFFAVRYIGNLVNAAKPKIINERRKARQHSQANLKDLSIDETQANGFDRPTLMSSILEGSGRDTMYAPHESGV